MENIQKKIDRNPFILDKTAKPRVLTITQSTYDGVLYNVEEIKDMLDGKIDTLHFDEAWLPHATFHDFYGDYHAIGEGRPRCKESMVFQRNLRTNYWQAYLRPVKFWYKMPKTISWIATFSTKRI